MSRVWQYSKYKNAMKSSPTVYLIRKHNQVSKYIYYKSPSLILPDKEIVIPSRFQFQTPLFWGLKDMAPRTSGEKSLPPKPRGKFTPGLAQVRGSPLSCTEHNINSNAVKTSNIQSLDKRRKQLCLSFAYK